MDFSNIRAQAKRFFSNPNTVTFLLVIILIIVVYFVYANMVTNATKPVSVPYAVNAIGPRTVITRNDIGTVKVSSSFLTSSGNKIITTQANIVDKYVAPTFQIPANSFFYSDALTDRDTADTTAFDDLPNGYTIYNLKTDFHKTYGCSIMPGNYIDLFMKTEDEDGNIVFGLFIKSIQVRDVVDSKKNNVYKSTNDNAEPQPDELWFAVPTYYYELLKKAELIGDIEFVPVPRNLSYTENPEGTEIVDNDMEGLIIRKSVILSGT